MDEPKRWEVWYANFPYDDDPGRSSDRPVIVLNTKPLMILSVKVTSHGVRTWDKYDIKLEYWREAGLTLPSVARISEVIYLSKDKFRCRVGTLHPEDAKNILSTYDIFIKELKSITTEAARETVNEGISEESTGKASNDEVKSSFFTNNEKEKSHEAQT